MMSSTSTTTPPPPQSLSPDLTPKVSFERIHLTLDHSNDDSSSGFSNYSEFQLDDLADLELPDLMEAIRKVKAKNLIRWEEDLMILLRNAFRKQMWYDCIMSHRFKVTKTEPGETSGSWPSYRTMCDHFSRPESNNTAAPEKGRNGPTPTMFDEIFTISKYRVRIAWSRKKSSHTIDEPQRSNKCAALDQTLADHLAYQCVVIYFNELLNDCLKENETQLSIHCDNGEGSLTSAISSGRLFGPDIRWTTPCYPHIEHRRRYAAPPPHVFDLKGEPARKGCEREYTYIPNPDDIPNPDESQSSSSSSRSAAPKYIRNLKSGFLLVRRTKPLGSFPRDDCLETFRQSGHVFFNALCPAVKVRDGEESVFPALRRHMDYLKRAAQFNYARYVRARVRLISTTVGSPRHIEDEMASSGNNNGLSSFISGDLDSFLSRRSYDSLFGDAGTISHKGEAFVSTMKTSEHVFPTANHVPSRLRMERYLLSYASKLEIHSTDDLTVCNPFTESSLAKYSLNLKYNLGGDIGYPLLEHCKGRDYADEGRCAVEYVLGWTMLASQWLIPKSHFTSRFSPLESERNVINGIIKNRNRIMCPSSVKDLSPNFVLMPSTNKFRQPAGDRFVRLYDYENFPNFLKRTIMAEPNELGPGLVSVIPEAHPKMESSAFKRLIPSLSVERTSDGRIWSMSSIFEMMGLDRRPLWPFAVKNVLVKTVQSPLIFRNVINPDTMIPGDVQMGNLPTFTSFYNRMHEITKLPHIPNRSFLGRLKLRFEVDPTAGDTTSSIITRGTTLKPSGATPLSLEDAGCTFSVRENMISSLHNNEAGKTSPVIFFDDRYPCFSTNYNHCVCESEVNIYDALKTVELDRSKRKELRRQQRYPENELPFSFFGRSGEDFEDDVDDIDDDDADKEPSPLGTTTKNHIIPEVDEDLLDLNSNFESYTTKALTHIKSALEHSQAKYRESGAQLSLKDPVVLEFLNTVRYIKEVDSTSNAQPGTKSSLARAMLETLKKQTRDILGRNNKYNTVLENLERKVSGARHNVRVTLDDLYFLKCWALIRSPARVYIEGNPRDEDIKIPYISERSENAASLYGLASFCYRSLPPSADLPSGKTTSSSRHLRMKFLFFSEGLQMVAMKALEDVHLSFWNRFKSSLTWSGDEDDPTSDFGTPRWNNDIYKCPLGRGSEAFLSLLAHCGGTQESAFLDLSSTHEGFKLNVCGFSLFPNRLNCLFIDRRLSSSPGSSDLELVASADPILSGDVLRCLNRRSKVHSRSEYRRGLAPTEGAKPDLLNNCEGCTLCGHHSRISDEPDCNLRTVKYINLRTGEQIPSEDVTTEGKLSNYRYEHCMALAMEAPVNGEIDDARTLEFRSSSSFSSWGSSLSSSSASSSSSSSSTSSFDDWREGEDQNNWREKKTQRSDNNKTQHRVGKNYGKSATYPRFDAGAGFSRDDKHTGTYGTRNICSSSPLFPRPLRPLTSLWSLVGKPIPERIDDDTRKRRLETPIVAVGRDGDRKIYSVNQHHVDGSFLASLFDILRTRYLKGLIQSLEKKREGHRSRRLGCGFASFSFHQLLFTSIHVATSESLDHLLLSVPFDRNEPEANVFFTPATNSWNTLKSHLKSSGLSGLSGLRLPKSLEGEPKNGLILNNAYLGTPPSQKNEYYSVYETSYQSMLILLTSVLQLYVCRQENTGAFVYRAIDQFNGYESELEYISSPDGSENDAFKAHGAMLRKNYLQESKYRPEDVGPIYPDSTVLCRLPFRTPHQNANHIQQQQQPGPLPEFRFVPVEFDTKLRILSDGHRFAKSVERGYDSVTMNPEGTKNLKESQRCRIWDHSDEGDKILPGDFRIYPSSGTYSRRICSKVEDLPMDFLEDDLCDCDNCLDLCALLSESQGCWYVLEQTKADEPGRMKYQTRSSLLESWELVENHIFNRRTSAVEEEYHQTHDNNIESILSEELDLLFSPSVEKRDTNTTTSTTEKSNPGESVRNILSKLRENVIEPSYMLTLLRKLKVGDTVGIGGGAFWNEPKQDYETLKSWKNTYGVSLESSVAELNRHRSFRHIRTVMEVSIQLCITTWLERGFCIPHEPNATSSSRSHTPTFAQEAKSTLGHISEAVGYCIDYIWIRRRSRNDSRNSGTFEGGHTHWDKMDSTRANRHMHLYNFNTGLGDRNRNIDTEDEGKYHLAFLQRDLLRVNRIAVPEPRLASVPSACPELDSNMLNMRTEMSRKDFNPFSPGFVASEFFGLFGRNYTATANLGPNNGVGTARLVLALVHLAGNLGSELSSVFHPNKMFSSRKTGSARTDSNGSPKSRLECNDFIKAYICWASTLKIKLESPTRDIQLTPTSETTTTIHEPSCMGECQISEKNVNSETCLEGECMVASNRPILTEGRSGRYKFAGVERDWSERKCNPSNVEAEMTLGDLIFHCYFELEKEISAIFDYWWRYLRTADGGTAESREHQEKSGGFERGELILDFLGRLISLTSVNLIRPPPPPQTKPSKPTTPKESSIPELNDNNNCCPGCLVTSSQFTVSSNSTAKSESDKSLYATPESDPRYLPAIRLTVCNTDESYLKAHDTYDSIGNRLVSFLNMLAEASHTSTNDANTVTRRNNTNTTKKRPREEHYPPEGTRPAKKIKTKPSSCSPAGFTTDPRPKTTDTKDNHQKTDYGHRCAIIHLYFYALNWNKSRGVCSLMKDPWTFFSVPKPEGWKGDDPSHPYRLPTKIIWTDARSITTRPFFRMETDSENLESHLKNHVEVFLT